MRPTTGLGENIVVRFYVHGDSSQHYKYANFCCSQCSTETGNSNGVRVQLRACKHSMRACEYVNIDGDKLVAYNQTSLALQRQYDFAGASTRPKLNDLDEASEGQLLHTPIETHTATSPRQYSFWTRHLGQRVFWDHTSGIVGFFEAHIWDSGFFGNVQNMTSGTIAFLEQTSGTAFFLEPHIHLGQ